MAKVTICYTNTKAQVTYMYVPVQSANDQHIAVCLFNLKKQLPCMLMSVPFY